MNFLVTGAAGRLGSHIINILSENEHRVKAFDLLHVNWDRIESLNHVEPFPGDITDPSAVSKACSNVDVILHLAAILPPISEVRYP
jgi:nucleoside-diphosphate-sugar epimerase